MNKLLNNRIITFAIYLILFLPTLFSSNNQDTFIRFIILIIYCDLVIYIQSKNRNIRNKKLWYLYILIFSPIVFPLFLISDKRYFKKVTVIGGLNIIIWAMILYLWGQTPQIYNSLSIWDKNNIEIQKIDQQYPNINWSDLTDESSNLITNLSNKKLEKLNNISNSIETIKNNILIKSSTEQSEHYKKWSDSLEKQTTTMNMYIGIFKAIKENQPIDSINKLISNWEIEDKKIAATNIEPLKLKPIIIQSFKSVNQVSVLFSLGFVLSIFGIITYIKFFGLKTWKLKIIFGLNTIVNLFLLSSLFLIGYF